MVQLVSMSRHHWLRCLYYLSLPFPVLCQLKNESLVCFDFHCQGNSIFCRWLGLSAVLRTRVPHAAYVILRGCNVCAWFRCFQQTQVARVQLSFTYSCIVIPTPLCGHSNCPEPGLGLSGVLFYSWWFIVSNAVLKPCDLESVANDF